MAKQETSVAGVTIEWDNANHPRLNAYDSPMDKTKIPQGNGDKFTPKRIIANLKLDLGDASKVREEMLGGKQQKVVDLIDVHLKVTSQGQKPRLAWWNGANWVEFDVTYNANTMVADVTLPSKSWPIDPPIGMSP
jgi:hypothetical protein